MVFKMVLRVYITLFLMFAVDFVETVKDVAFMVRNFSECVEYVKEEIHEGF